jgi:hypothetical protein
LADLPPVNKIAKKRKIIDDNILIGEKRTKNKKTKRKDKK